MNEIAGIYCKWQNKLEIEYEWIEPYQISTLTKKRILISIMI